MTPATKVRRAALVVLAFLAGELGIMALSLALAFVTGAACTTAPMAEPVCLAVGLILVVVAVAATVGAALLED